MNAGDVGIVIVSYEGRELLRRCLHAVPPDCPVVVVDNASTDGSSAMVMAEFPAVRLIASPENLGFGRANNLGEAELTTPLVLYLNPDCFLDPAALDQLTEVFEDGAVVAAGARLRNADGSFQPCAARALTLWAVLSEQLFIERLTRSYWMPDLTETTPVAQCIGACLLVRRGLESFNERFFLYCEDTDLCRRLRVHGTILHVPSAGATHVLGASSTKDRWRSVARYNRGKELYFLIHHGRWAFAVCIGLNRLGACLRLAVGILGWPFRENLRDKARTFWRVLKVPVGGPTRSPVHKLR